MGIPKENISIESHPCDENIFGSIDFKNKIQLRKKLGLPKDKLILLNIGRIQPRKNQLFIIEVLGKLNDQNLLLVLIGPYDKNDEYFNKLKEYVRSHGLEKQVRIEGEKRNINEYMIVSDLFAFSSRKEGFPNVIAEAIVSGLPIVTTNIDCIKPYINKQNGILVDNAEKFDESVAKQYSAAIRKAIDKIKSFNRHSIREFGISRLSSKKLDEEKNLQYMELLR